MKRKIYIARRISLNKNPDTLLVVNEKMSVSGLLDLYSQKYIEYEKYIHNGHWIIRPVDTKNMLAKYNLPVDIQPKDIWQAVTQKINTSDAFVAFVNKDAFGVIAELGYATGTKKIAVYVLPEPDISNAEIVELWLSFQSALSTKDLWKQNDIEAISEFQNYGINTIEDYIKYINSIVPPFLLK